ncbi:hypothetical protein [Serratia plymuthica]|uniref:hypothetical protein n=1 Tax=Serratia plymuthica TaxID=82996 RepID=UPI0018D805C5|nr:hypothetical protein [Serratia plymuthica]QPS54976.1 hypothetical protein I6G53_20375 [Serratia plymuthica]CAI1855161.1 Uncharacterised protein [Serratia plymuthica]
MADITLEQATERARQAEVICRILEHYPNSMDAYEIGAIASLLSKLTGNVAAWLVEESALKESK